MVLFTTAIVPKIILSVKLVRLSPITVTRAFDADVNAVSGVVPISCIKEFPNVVAIFYPNVKTYSIAMFVASLKLIPPPTPDTPVQIDPL